MESHAGGPVGVLVRTAAEMAAVVAGNSSPDASPSRTVAIFLEEREIYVRYGEGMGRSRLKIAAAATGTARNINTITRLAEMAAELG